MTAQQMLGELVLMINEGIQDQDFKGIIAFAESITLRQEKFSFVGHEYQKAWFEETARRQCHRKGAQMGCTETQIIISSHGMINRRYPQGVLYLFPTKTDSLDFSKGRWQPMIAENQQIAKYVTDTDAVGIKRVGSSMLYLRGATAKGKIEGIKKTSTSLKTIPVDRVVFDEVDEMLAVMIALALERMGHSYVKEESYLSTPSVPDWGIDKLYNNSSQRIWLITCQHCNTKTCLELTFPDCIKLDMVSGRYFRACKKCGREIFPRDGQWVAQYPDKEKDMVGWWISQLNSIFIDPGDILNLFENPPNGNITEVYNSKLGMAHVSAENRITERDVKALCGDYITPATDQGPCCAGVDVGTYLHITIGYRLTEEQKNIIYIGRVESFKDLHDLCARFNVKQAVIDLYPEQRKVREFQRQENFEVWACQYSEEQATGPVFNDKTRIVTVNRTEVLDQSHEAIRIPGRLEIPRLNDEIKDVFAVECSNIAKVLEQNKITGKNIYRYRKLGPDHYRHSLTYMLLAARRIGISHNQYARNVHLQVQAITDYPVLPGQEPVRHLGQLQEIADIG